MENRLFFENLVRIKNSPEFEPLRQWLNTKREEARDRLAYQSDEIVFRREQGVVQTYDRILGLIESAHETLEKMS